MTSQDDWIAESERMGHVPPLHKRLGLTIEQMEPFSIVSLPFSEDARGAVAPVHGGVLATLADVACGAAVGMSFDPTVEFPVSTDVHIRYYRQPKSWPLRAEGRVVHRGRTILSSEAVVTDADDRQIARATATYMIVRGFGDLGTKPEQSEAP